MPSPTLWTLFVGSYCGVSFLHCLDAISCIALVSERSFWGALDYRFRALGSWEGYKTFEKRSHYCPRALLFFVGYLVGDQIIGRQIVSRQQVFRELKVFQNDFALLPSGRGFLLGVGY